jgi:hypothetical protein
MEVGTNIARPAKKPAVCPQPALKKDKPAFNRCLLARFNAIRQKKQQPVFKTIKGFTKLLNTGNATETYAVLADAQHSKKYKWTNFDPYEDEDRSLADLKRLLGTYAGKDIRVCYILTDGTIIRDNYYNIPNSQADINKAWDSWKWNYALSDETVFSQNEDGYVHIVESQVVLANNINQLYLDNKTGTCFTKPVRDYCLTKLKDKANKNYQTILNKLTKIEQKYKTGIPDNLMDTICNSLNIRVKITMPFEIKTTIYGKPKGMMTLEYINNRFNHLAIAGEMYKTSEPIMLSPDAFLDKLKEVSGALPHNDYTEEAHYFQKNDGGIYHLITSNNSYRIEREFTADIKAFEQKYNLTECKLDYITEPLLCGFIDAGCKQTSSVHNKAITNPAQYKNTFEEIDQVKSYTQFKQCSFYEGFVGNFSDFRQCDKIEGVGYYLIGNINWTKCDPKMKEIQRTFGIYYGRNVYSSPELKMLLKAGATFKILGGAWGITKHFEFDEGMMKKTNGVPNYSRWTGIQNGKEEYDYYYSNNCELEFREFIQANLNENMRISYHDGQLRFGIKKASIKTNNHISGFIYSYQRLNLIEQLLEMDVSKVIKINVDGIKYIPHSFVMKPTFIMETDTKPRTLMSECREDGFIAGNNCDKLEFLMELHNHFKNTHLRAHYANELFLGAGGTGKTHYNITDKGLLDVCYVAPSYKLTSAMRAKHGCDTLVLAVLFTGIGDGNKETRIGNIKKKYKTLIIDEVSMMTEKSRAEIFKLYGDCKLIFCGDVGYQAKPIVEIGERPVDINIKAFENVRTYTHNYRIKCDKLRAVCDTLRHNIKNNQMVSVEPFEITTVAIVRATYKIDDIVLLHLHKTEDKYNSVLVGDKYLITTAIKNYNRGEIVFNDLGKSTKKTHAFTAHSVQGETFERNIYIDMELLRDARLFYTAISRANYLSQIYLVA